MKKILNSHEFVVFLILVIISIVIGLRNPLFFSASAIFDIIRGSIVYCIMALGVLMVLISGNVDISFVAIAAMASYSTHMLLLGLGYTGGIGLYLVIAIFFGLLVGLAMAFITTQFNLPIFYVSLGYQTLWYGFNLFFVGRAMNFDLPEGLVGYYSRFLVRVKDPVAGETGLHVSVIYLLVIAIFIWWLLKYTTFGRGLYAMGGNREVAIRAGFNVKSITYLMLALSGGLAAVAGVIQSAYSRFFNPVLFMGQDLDVIAAVVIGGAAITGGRGSVIGTILGVVLIQVLNRGLIFMGVSAEWQKMVVGLVLIIFVSIPAIAERRQGRLKYFPVSKEK
ncbi:MAG: simple sugar transport system permease protein [Candidatus Atribacteria bacterium]|nr:simple sugar transport system permease protein [Candidatus Atribacteria bacterium]